LSYLPSRLRRGLKLPEIKTDGKRQCHDQACKPTVIRRDKLFQDSYVFPE
jgi:hypothetical protein